MVKTEKAEMIVRVNKTSLCNNIYLLDDDECVCSVFGTKPLKEYFEAYVGSKNQIRNGLPLMICYFHHSQKDFTVCRQFNS